MYLWYLGLMMAICIYDNYRKMRFKTKLDLRSTTIRSHWQSTNRPDLNWQQFIQLRQVDTIRAVPRVMGNLHPLELSPIWRNLRSAQVRIWAWSTLKKCLSDEPPLAADHLRPKMADGKANKSSDSDSTTVWESFDVINHRGIAPNSTELIPGQCWVYHITVCSWHEIFRIHHFPPPLVPSSRIEMEFRVCLDSEFTSVGSVCGGHIQWIGLREI